jgi:hypothetical protein
MSVPAAGRLFGLSRDTSYRLVARGEFPVPVIRAGRKIVVSRAALARVLGTDAPSDPLSEAASPQVSDVSGDPRSPATTGNTAA